jgi:hypothetical protein
MEALSTEFLAMRLWLTEPNCDRIEMHLHCRSLQQLPLRLLDDTTATSFSRIRS